jgi:hypothetical protein
MALLHKKARRNGRNINSTTYFLTRAVFLCAFARGPSGDTVSSVGFDAARPRLAASRSISVIGEPG